MTHSRSRGLLYTTPPAENDDAPTGANEREETAERPESTAERPLVEHANRGHAVADD